MEAGEKINVTDGRGTRMLCEITTAHKKHATVTVIEDSYTEQSARKVIIGISLVKNASRFEWFLEKATEIGVAEIYPLICARTEKEKFREERLQGIVTSAMLQSQQVWMPILHQPIDFDSLVESDAMKNISTKYIAHCLDTEKQTVSSTATGNVVMLIGPEGDFTPEEIDLAIQLGFLPATLGDTRLRTETAGMVAGVLLKIGLTFKV